MLKNKVWALILGAALFASCKEQGPSINFEDVVADPSDTTYITTNIPAAQLRNVLIEEFTGVSCPNCPAGHDIINGIKNSANGNQLVAVGLYKTGLTLTAPVAENGTVHTEDDFRTKESNDIDTKYYSGGAGTLPSAGFDRANIGTTKLLDRAQWVSTFNSRALVPSPVKLEATSTYNDADSTLKVKITATFTTEVNHNVYLTAGIVQDSIVDYQEKGTLIIPEYLHNHVFRGLIVPNENGIQLGVDAVHEVGRVYVKTLNYKLTDLGKKNGTELDMQYVHPEHCRVFIFLHRSDVESTEVLQALEVHMK